MGNHTGMRHRKFAPSLDKFNRKGAGPACLWKAGWVSPQNGANIRLFWVKNLGYHVPDDIGIDFLSLHPEEFNFSGAIQNCEVIGATAVDVMTEEMNHNHLGVPNFPKLVYIESSWPSGSTTHPSWSG